MLCHDLAILYYWAIFLAVGLNDLLTALAFSFGEAKVIYILSKFSVSHLWFNVQILRYTKTLVIVCVLYFVMLQRIKHKQYPSSWHHYAFLFPPSVAYFGCNNLNAFVYQTSLNGCWVYWPSWQYLIFHLWKSDFFFHWRGEDVHWWREKETIFSQNFHKSWRKPFGDSSICWRILLP